MWFDQAGYDIRAEWGREGLAALAGVTDVFVIVDVLSFSTCVDVAVARGALVYPCAEGGDAARELAARVGAVCAGARHEGGFSLSPRSFASVDAGARIVLASPNGGGLSAQSGGVPTFCACLRNASAVARATQRLGRRLSVIAAGERWPSGSLRPALEDWVGVGAVVAALTGRPSPEAEAARSAFEMSSPRLQEVLLDCASGRQLVGLGFEEDVVMAAASEASRCAPALRDLAFRDAARET